MKKMVDGSLPNGTLIRACEGTFDYLEKQDDRIAKLEAALREIANFDLYGDYSNAYEIQPIARKALDAE
jgi:hypothetical protein